MAKKRKNPYEAAKRQKELEKKKKKEEKKKRKEEFQDIDTNETIDDLTEGKSPSDEINPSEGI